MPQGNTSFAGLARARDRFLGHLRSPSDRKAVLYIVAIAAGFLLLTTLLHLPHGPEHWSADFRTAHLSPRPATQDKRIAIVYVSEKTLEKHPYLSPTDRQLLADLVKAVDAAGAKAIGFDFIVDRPTEPAKDDALVAALRDTRAPVVIGAVDDPLPHGNDKTYQAQYIEKVTAKPERLVGHLYFEGPHGGLIISDHVVRQTAKPKHKYTHDEPFAEQLASKVGNFRRPKSEYISWLLPPTDGTETFMTLTAEEVLGRSGPPLPVKAMLADRVVLIGGNFSDRDQHLIPLSVTDGRRYPGLFVHAQILAQILDQRSLSTMPIALQVALYVLVAAGGFWIGRNQTRIHLVTELVAVIALVALGWAAFKYASLIFPYTGVLLAGLGGVSAGYYSRPHHA